MSAPLKLWIVIVHDDLCESSRPEARAYLTEEAAQRRADRIELALGEGYRCQVMSLTMKGKLP